MSKLPVSLKFGKQLSVSDPSQNPVLIVGQTKNLLKAGYNGVKMKLEPRVSEELYKSALESLHTDSVSLYLNLATVAALPSKCSRHNTPSRAHSLTKIVKNGSSEVDEYIVVICEKSDMFASACAVARAFPHFSRKTGSTSTQHSVTVEFLLIDKESPSVLEDSEVECLTIAAQGVQLSAKIVDTPCSEMNVDMFLQEIKNVGQLVGIVPTIIRGNELEEKGFGGLHNVGKAATHTAALAVLSHLPEGAKETIAWVGKGIVFDTGGLCIKTKTGMVSMKQDCGGAAGILGAFLLAVKMGFKENLHAVFCLAENSVGPNALRPDDIITMYSGRTVEVNNTDAEGRLVLGDGVVYAERDLKANIILDMATLTGAQGAATGKLHAAVITNSQEWEEAIVYAGQASGDLVHPLPYCPELHFSEFASAVADMKNSVADRSNAQCSCAGLFIGAHLGFDYPGVWIHVDMASPVHCGERATGYGVSLLNALFGYASQDTLLQSLSSVSQLNGCDLGLASKKMRLA